ncbi:hypothetical protein V8E54_009253 [Elaphomyces granulatus]
MSSPSPAGSRSRSSDDDEGPLHKCSNCRRQLSLSFFAAEGDRQFATCNICRVNQRRNLIQQSVVNSSWGRGPDSPSGCTRLPATAAPTKTGSRRICLPNPPRRNVTHGVMSERYHLGGRVETDTVAMAAARQDQAGIQRRHRLERCHGEDPSQTPPFISLVARHEISQGTEEPPPQQPLQSANPSLETSLGVDVLPRRGRPSLPDDPAQPRPGRPRLPEAPPSDRVAAGDAMSAAHWARVGSFRRALYGEIKEYCSQCHEDMQLNRDAVCHRCLLKDKDKEPPLLSDDNEMDPGEVPEHLPALSQVEMLIARVHLHLEAKRIRGLQYQYTGHTVCFMNNSTKQRYSIIIERFLYKLL